MSTGDYQSFNLDLRDIGCVEEVVSAIIQRICDQYQDEINDLKIENGGLEQECANMDLKIRELEEELVKERGKYEN